MNGQDAVWSQMTQINNERLASEQMNGNGVAGESVEHEHIEVLRRGLPFPRQTCIARHHFDFVPPSFQKMKLGASNTFHVFVDFVEPKRVARTGIGGNRADAEPDDTHSVWLTIHVRQQ